MKIIMIQITHYQLKIVLSKIKPYLEYIKNDIKKYETLKFKLILFILKKMMKSVYCIQKRKLNDLKLKNLKFNDKPDEVIK